MAIGAINGGSSASGDVRIYSWTGSAWSQLGSNINGEANSNQSGWSVSLSNDGNRVAISSKDNAGGGGARGHVRIYNYSSSAWSQYGNDIDGEADSDHSGYSIALSGDGSKVAIGANENDATGSNAGHCRVYKHLSTCSGSNPLLIAVNTTFTGNYKDTDGSGWSHYCNSDDYLLLSLKIGSSGAVVNASEVTLRTGSSSTYSSASSGGLIVNSSGYAIIDRRWNVAPTTQPSSGNVGVKYYFTNAEYTAEVAALAALSSPTTLTNANQLQMYKTTSGAAFANPHTVSGSILIHGSTPSATVWKWAQYGTSDHSAEFEVASFSGGGSGGGGNNSPLPVKLVSLKGMVLNADAELYWTTASEINNERFDIERSWDNVNWIKVGSVEGKGNSSQLNQYSFLDLNITSFNKSIAIYRLKQIDYNGIFEYSEPLALNLNHQNLTDNPIISPNPFTDEFYVILSSNQQTQVAISTLFGAILLEKTVWNEKETINTSGLSPGIYILSLTTNSITKNYKVIKK